MKRTIPYYNSFNLIDNHNGGHYFLTDKQIVYLQLWLQFDHI